MRRYCIAAIPGDGIGKEVVPEGIRVLDAAGRKAGFQLDWHHFPWSCEYYHETGRMMPDTGVEKLRGFDAIFLGAVGFPGVRDHISLWGLLIPIRRAFEQYANVRPVRLMPGLRSPLRDREIGDIDFVIVRENNEGEYSNIGGRIFEGTVHEVVAQHFEPSDGRPAFENFRVVHGSQPDTDAEIFQTKAIRHFRRPNKR